MKKIHQCTNKHPITGKAKWIYCIVCDGRVHLDGCTIKRNKHKDCCKKRHEMLYNQGHKVGICDSSIPMLGSHAEKVCGF